MIVQSPEKELTNSNSTLRQNRMLMCSKRSTKDRKVSLTEKSFRLTKKSVDRSPHTISVCRTINSVRTKWKALRFTYSCRHWLENSNHKCPRATNVEIGVDNGSGSPLFWIHLQTVHVPYIMYSEYAKGWGGNHRIWGEMQAKWRKRIGNWKFMEGVGRGLGEKT